MSSLFPNAAPLGERITEAIRRVTYGLGSMRIPCEATDPDIVLIDCRDEIAALQSRLDAATSRAERAERMLADVVRDANDADRKFRAALSAAKGEGA